MSRGDVIVALLLAAGTISCARPIRIAAPSSPTTSVSDEVRAVVELINQHRKQIGCKPLEWDRTVADVAQKHSADMVNRNFFSHINPDGLNAFQDWRAPALPSRARPRTSRWVKARADRRSGRGLSSAGRRGNIEDCKPHLPGSSFARGAASLPYGTVTNAWVNVFVAPR